MTSKHPLISVVIPTYNRPALLPYAVKSALDQTADSALTYEVIVSANGILEGTREAMRPYMDHPRLRYVEVGRDVDAFTSWHFATSHATGDYVFLLADDDCLLPNSVAIWAQTIKQYNYPDYIAPAGCWYGHATVEPPRHNALRFATMWQREGVADPKALLQEFFSFGNPTFSPTYSLTLKHIRSALKDRNINPYVPIFPDYGMQAMGLALARTAVLMKNPTVVHGYAAESAGETHFDPANRIAWRAPDGESSVFQCSPLHGQLFINGWAETLLRAKQRWPEIFAGVELNLGQFYLRYTNQLLEHAQYYDVADWTTELVRAIKSEAEPIKQMLLTSETMVNLLTRLLALVEHEAYRHADPRLTAEWIRGSHFGFNTIAEAAANATQLYEQKLAAEQFIQTQKGAK